MPRESKKARIARMYQEYEQLCVEIPDPKCALNFNSPFELLVATVLSAQTTDKRGEFGRGQGQQLCFVDQQRFGGNRVFAFEIIAETVGNGFEHGEGLHIGLLL